MDEDLFGCWVGFWIEVLGIGVFFLAGSPWGWWGDEDGDMMGWMSGWLRVMGGIVVEFWRWGGIISGVAARE